MLEINAKSIVCDMPWIHDLNLRLLKFSIVCDNPIAKDWPVEGTLKHRVTKQMTLSNSKRIKQSSLTMRLLGI